MDTHFSCTGRGGFMYEGVAVGTAASVLSFATNLAATTLTAYKAWYVSSLRPRQPVSVELTRYSLGFIEGASGDMSRADRGAPKWRAFSLSSSSLGRSTAHYGCVAIPHTCSGLYVFTYAYSLAIPRLTPLPADCGRRVADRGQDQRPSHAFIHLPLSILLR